MNTQEIYKLAEELTEEKVNEIVKGWENNQNKQPDGFTFFERFNTLVRLGDSKGLACATVILNNPTTKEVAEDYRFAYEN